MKKLVYSLGLMLSISTLAGCELYFGGNGDGGGSWNYCGSDGYYQCTGNDCTWVSSTCPSGTDGGSGSGSGSGYECGQNTDCASGCYCSNGTCTEGGFCSQDSDCGPGYHCDTSRSSCEPNPPTPTCSADTDCPQGQYCDTASGACTASCTCTSDADAIAQGFGWCDPARQTCMTGQDPNGTCGGTADPSCTALEPTCPSGQVPLLLNGCWTGNCEAFGSCDVAPVCADVNDETDCLGTTENCSATYTGIDCTKPDGTACHSGDTNCTCASFQFASCVDKDIGRQLVQDQGHPILTSH